MRQPHVANVLVLAVFAGACSGTGDANPDSTAGAMAPEPAAADSGTAGASSAGGAIVRTAIVAGIGTYLTDATGRALYRFEKDSTGRSTCDADCAAAWPPYLSPGAPSAADTVVRPALLTTIVRPDGNRQVAYNGMPLYYYAKDVRPEDTNGQDIESFGAEWYLVAPDGTKREGK
jgi:predicted lipoprotein with Yx(FWY)xxD motif